MKLQNNISRVKIGTSSFVYLLKNKNIKDRQMPAHMQQKVLVLANVKINDMWLNLTKQGFDAQSFVRRYGDFKESLCNNFRVPTAVQTKFAPIVHLFTSYHWVGVYISDTQNLPCFEQLFSRG